MKYTREIQQNQVNKIWQTSGVCYSPLHEISIVSRTVLFMVEMGAVARARMAFCVLIFTNKTRWVDGTPTSEVTPVTIW